MNGDLVVRRLRQPAQEFGEVFVHVGGGPEISGRVRRSQRLAGRLDGLVVVATAAAEFGQPHRDGGEVPLIGGTTELAAGGNRQTIVNGPAIGRGR